MSNRYYCRADFDEGVSISDVFGLSNMDHAQTVHWVWLFLFCGIGKYFATY